MKKTSRAIAIIVLVVWFLGAFVGATAQNVVRVGNVFEQVEKKGLCCKDCLHVQGQKWDIISHLSLIKGKGLYYLPVQKTGRKYKRYLPKVTEQLKKERK